MRILLYCWDEQPFHYLVLDLCENLFTNKSDVNPSYLSVPNRETSEISTVAVLTQLINSRLVREFENETYNTQLHF
jgi:hypothetical protein